MRLIGPVTSPSKETHMRTTLSAVAQMLAVTGLLTAVPQPAAAYKIDCAILLCLAGGSPPSATCVAARAEFIRRITPGRSSLRFRSRGAHEGAI